MKNSAVGNGGVEGAGVDERGEVKQASVGGGQVEFAARSDVNVFPSMESGIGPIDVDEVAGGAGADVEVSHLEEPAIEHVHLVVRIT